MHKMIRSSGRIIGRRFDRILFAFNIPSLTVAAALLIISRLIMARMEIPDGFYGIYFAAVYIAVAYSFAVTLVITVNANMRLRGHEKYTYMEIFDSQMVVSEYVSTVYFQGKFHDYRRLWVINLADIEQVTCTRSRIVIKSKARLIEQRADWLEYSEEDGRISFDYWWYNDYGGELVETAEFADNYFYAERAAQRIIFCSQKQKEREVRRSEFRKRMLEIAGRSRTERRKKPKERVFRGYEIERKF